jgi:hypothetical protein
MVDRVGAIYFSSLGLLIMGLASLPSYCYKMKTIQAFSWALFCAFAIAIIILFQLVQQAQRFGRWQIWSEPIRGLSLLT